MTTKAGEQTMQYDLVIIGATAAALGLAQTVKESLRTLIVNRTEMVVYEFVNTYKLSGVYSRGAVYNREFRELGVDVLLGTEVAGITKKPGGGYVLEILNTGGFQTVEAAAVVDTTIEEEASLAGKSLNALIIHQSGADLPQLDWKGITLIPEQHEHAYTTAILKLSCPVEWSLAEARHRLVDAWLKRPEELKEWRMATIAFSFEELPVQVQKVKDERYVLLSSAGFNSPEASVEAGVQLGRSLVS